MPTLQAFPGDHLLERLTERVGVRPRPLADPPAGSGLAPVPGEPGLPLIGKTLQMLREGPIAARSYHAKYGDVFWTNAFGQRMVMVIGPEPIQQVLTNRDKSWSQSGWEYFIGPFFRRGLMLLDEPEHLVHRRIMQEAFTRSRLEGYLTEVTAIIDEAVASWPDGEQLLFPAIKGMSLDVATRVFMGAAHSPEADRLTAAFIDTVRAGTGFVRRPVPLLPTRWNAGLAGRRVLEDWFRPLVATKRASQDTDLFAALTHAVSEDGHSFSDEDVVDHMIFLMMAAHDTSTITASATAYYLARHPAWQERCRAESLALDGALDGPVDLAALEQLTSLDLVFREAMRLVAPVPALARRALRDTELQGRFVPAGTLVAVVPGAMHLLPDHWSDPESFDPERFGPERAEDKSHRFVSAPFGGGAHKCIGMAFGSAEVKALLHRMLLDLELSVPDGYEVAWDHTSLVVPLDGLPVTLRRR